MRRSDAYRSASRPPVGYCRFVVGWCWFDSDTGHQRKETYYFKIFSLNVRRTVARAIIAQPELLKIVAQGTLSGGIGPARPSSSRNGLVFAGSVQKLPGGSALSFA